MTGIKSDVLSIRALLNSRIILFGSSNSLIKKCGISPSLSNLGSNPMHTTLRLSTID